MEGDDGWWVSGSEIVVLTVVLARNYNVCFWCFLRLDVLRGLAAHDRLMWTVLGATAMCSSFCVCIVFPSMMFEAVSLRRV